MSTQCRAGARSVLVAILLALTAQAVPTIACAQSVAEQPAAPLPVLFYDISGSTLIGPTHLHLAVYANGQASIAREDDQLLSGDGDRVLQRGVPVARVRELQAALRRAGAARISPPRNTGTADLPLSTVTFFAVSRSNAVGHSFSYFDAPGRVGEIARIIEAFIDEIFPDIRT